MTAHMMTIHAPGGRSFTVTRSGVVTREDRATVTEADVTAVTAVLSRSDQHELAGRVQGWWWTSGGARPVLNVD